MRFTCRIVEVDARACACACACDTCNNGLVAFAFLYTFCWVYQKVTYAAAIETDDHKH